MVSVVAVCGVFVVVVCGVCGGCVWCLCIIIICDGCVVDCLLLQKCFFVGRVTFKIICQPP